MRHSLHRHQTSAAASGSVLRCGVSHLLRRSAIGAGYQTTAVLITFRVRRAPPRSVGDASDPERGGERETGDMMDDDAGRRADKYPTAARRRQRYRGVDPSVTVSPSVSVLLRSDVHRVAAAAESVRWGGGRRAVRFSAALLPSCPATPVSTLVLRLGAVFCPVWHSAALEPTVAAGSPGPADSVPSNQVRGSG